MIPGLMTLEGAREILADPSHWTQNMAYRDARGEPSNLRDAVCFCMLGAIRKAWVVRHEDEGDELAARLLNRFIPGPMTIGDWNDVPGRTHAEVVAKLDEAIEKVRTS